MPPFGGAVEGTGDIAPSSAVTARSSTRESCRAQAACGELPRNGDDPESILRQLCSTRSQFLRAARSWTRTRYESRQCARGRRPQSRMAPHTFAVKCAIQRISRVIVGPDIDGPIHGYFGRPIDEIPAPTLGVVPKGD